MDHTTEAGAAIVVEAETERITSVRGTFWVVRPLGGGQAIFDGKECIQGLRTLWYFDY